MPSRTQNSAFTLIETLLIIGLVSILIGIVIVAINPGRQFAMARNAERKLGIEQINAALNQYYMDNRAYPDTITGSLTEICNTGAEAVGHDIDCDGLELIDLSILVPNYLISIPTDPLSFSESGAGYKIIINNQNKIGLSAPAELDQIIVLGDISGD